MNEMLSPTLWALLFLLAGALLLVGLTILHRRRETEPIVRNIPAFRGLSTALERAAESGQPLHIALGTGGLGSQDTVASLAALQLLEGLADAAVAYDVPPVVTVGDPTLVPLAQDALRRAYERSKTPELYDSGQVRFVAPSSLAYSAAAVPVGMPEPVTANVVIGAFGSEVSLLANTGERLGYPNIAAIDSAQAAGVLYPATDRLAVGEELYAAGAQITKSRKYLTGLMTQDILRAVVTVAILAAAVVALISR